MLFNISYFILVICYLLLRFLLYDTNYLKLAIACNKIASFRSCSATRSCFNCGLYKCSFPILTKYRSQRKHLYTVQEYFFVKIFDNLHKDGVNIPGNKLVGYKSFVSTSDCSTCLIVF